MHLLFPQSHTLETNVFFPEFIFIVINFSKLQWISWAALNSVKSWNACEPEKNFIQRNDYLSTD